MAIAATTLAFGSVAVVIYMADSDDDPTLGVPRSSSGPTAAVSRPAATQQPLARTTAPPDWETDCPGVRRRVSYIATGSGTSSGSVTMAMPDGTQQAEVGLPMKNDSGTQGLHFCAAPGEFVYISVQNSNDSGRVTCSIEIDGETFAENSSSGAYVIATCDGSAP